MSEVVAVRNKRWASLEVFHEFDEDGETRCHFGGHGDQYRTERREDLPEHVTMCQNCDGRSYARGSETQTGWANKLRAADDPEEVLRS
jgi:hypothetical protein